MKRFAAVLVAFHAAAAAAPHEIAAEYQLTMEGLLIGRVSESYARDGDRYSIRSVTRSDGALKYVLTENLTLASEGRVVAQGLQPEEFEQRRTGNAAKDIHARFDWGRGIMHSTYRGEVHEIPLPRHTQDRISVMYQFMNVKLGAGPVELHMANGRKVERYTYRFVEQARLSTPAGEFDTVRYDRVTSGGKERKTQVWLARDRFNFPVRVVVDDPKGLRLEQTLVSLSMR